MKLRLPSINRIAEFSIMFVIMVLIVKFVVPAQYRQYFTV